MKTKALIFELLKIADKKRSDTYMVFTMYNYTSHGISLVLPYKQQESILQLPSFQTLFVRKLAETCFHFVVASNG